MQNQQNLKHSNLLELPLEGKNKILQGRATPVQAGQDTGMLRPSCCEQFLECCVFSLRAHSISLSNAPAAAAESSLDLTKNGDGFLSNVAESQRVAEGINATSAPAVDSKPLGFYFSKDIPGHVKEKALGTRSSENTNRPIDGKAAMSLYFNKDKVQPSRPESKAASASQTHEPDKHKFLQQSDEELSDLRADSAHVGIDSQDRVHRKVLRGISKGVQDDKAFDAGVSGIAGDAQDGPDTPRDVEKGANKSGGSLVIAVNSSSGQYKPLTQKSSLNTDDM